MTGTVSHILSLNWVNKQSEKLQIQARFRKRKQNSHSALLVSEILKNTFTLKKKKKNHKYQNCSCYRAKRRSKFLTKHFFGHPYNAKDQVSRMRSSTTTQTPYLGQLKLYAFGDTTDIIFPRTHLLIFFIIFI